MILFLDFDGVLHPVGSTGATILPPAAAGALLTESTGLAHRHLVILARYHFALDLLRQHFSPRHPGAH